MLFGHSQDLAAAMPLIRRMRPRWWKAIDPDVASAEECREVGVELIVRHAGPWDDGNPGAHITPEGFVRACQAEAWWDHAWAIETCNEAHPGDAEWMSEVVMRLRDVGKECVVGNWGTGWDGFYVQGAKFYGAHEYGWPFIQAQQPYHAYRCLDWFREVRKRTPDAKLLITECGVTSAVVGGPDQGWHTADQTAAEFWDHTVNYDRVLAAELGGAYLGSFIFQVGGNPDWSTFECLGSEIEDWMAAQQQQEAPMAESMVLGQGMRELAAQLGTARTGVQLTGELYLKDGQGKDTYSYAIFEKCEIRYYPVINRTVAVPFL